MKKSLVIFSTIIVLFCNNIGAQELKKEVFDIINLNHPGLEKVKNLHHEGKDKEAVEELLYYYRNRTNVKHPDIDINKVTISKQEQQLADDGMEHTFFAHKGYQPSFNYGADINWQYWPVKDNELRWQLHRHKWFSPMGKAYIVSGDEKYAKEWVLQYMDWIKKNPLIKIDKREYEKLNDKKTKGEIENMRFAWRPLEVSDRLKDQTGQFMYFVNSPNFTPEFLTEFLVNYHKHAIHIMDNYSKQGNHLLFEAQRMIYAGTLFPEYSDAMTWRKSGIDILNREIDVQVYDDGGQYELDPHYHLAAINIFYEAIQVADINGFKNEFSQKYLKTVEDMIMFYINICFPDLSNPCFSDAKLTPGTATVRDLKKWSEVFPENDVIRYFATSAAQGRLPEHLSKGFTTSGFYVFRNSWHDPATVMVLKAGPEGFWHCQPDNGTFELWINGKNFFPDSGSYIYGGEGAVMDARNWFRQTKVHNTLTLNERSLDSTTSKCRYWMPDGDTPTLVIENPSYYGLTHRRSVFFVNKTFFIIVDEAQGGAKGNVKLHYQLKEGKVNIDTLNLSLMTDFEGETNIALKCFPNNEKYSMNIEEGWSSTDYMKKTERCAVSFDTEKTNNETIRFITVIYPVSNGKKPKIEAKFDNKKTGEDTMRARININGKKYTVGYDL